MPGWKKISKRTSVSVYLRLYTINYNKENEDEKKTRSHRYDIDRPRSTMDTNIVNKKRVSVW